jgi:hypothetical protein
MRSDKALAKGWPIATGMIKGAGRFVRDGVGVPSTLGSNLRSYDSATSPSWRRPAGGSW